MLLQIIVMIHEKNGLSKNGSSTHDLKPNVLFKEIPAINLKKALIEEDQWADVLGELIATGESAFTFIRYSALEQPIKDAMYQLEKQFAFYKRLLGK